MIWKNCEGFAGLLRRCSLTSPRTAFSTYTRFFLSILWTYYVDNMLTNCSTNCWPYIAFFSFFSARRVDFQMLPNNQKCFYVVNKALSIVCKRWPNGASFVIVMADMFLKRLYVLLISSPVFWPNCLTKFVNVETYESCRFLRKDYLRDLRNFRVWSGAEVRKSCRPQKMLQKILTWKNRLRYSKERALQSDLLIFRPPPDFKFKSK